jgi:hypothetical protein
MRSSQAFDISNYTGGFQSSDCDIVKTDELKKLNVKFVCRLFYHAFSISCIQRRMNGLVAELEKGFARKQYQHPGICLERIKKGKQVKLSV